MKRMNNICSMSGNWRNSSRWQFLQLWGLDAPITAICWSVACAALMQVTMITPGPMLLVASCVWCANMQHRVRDAIKHPESWNSAFYRGHLPIILVLLFAVSMATLWMMLFYVGQNILPYLILPAGLYGIRGILPHTCLEPVRLLLKSIAFAMVCAVPAFYFCFTLTPFHLLTTGPIWYLGILFFLMARERQQLRTKEKNYQYVVVNTITLLMLLSATLISSVTAPMFERTLCITIAIGAGCLQGFSRILHLLPPGMALAFGWLSMAIPAVLGIILYAPHSW